MVFIKSIVDIFGLLMLLPFWCLLLCCTSNEPIIHPVHTQPLDIPITRKTKLIEVRPITLDLPEGRKLGKIGMGVLCLPMTDLITIGGKAPVSEGDFTNEVVNVLEKANYNLVSSNSNNIKSSRLEDELILKGVVKDIKANICFPNSGFRGWKIGKGDSYIKIDWNLISKQTNQTIFETTTEGSCILKDAIAFGPEKVILRSVAIATEKLLGDDNLVKLVLSSTK